MFKNHTGICGPIPPKRARGVFGYHDYDQISWFYCCYKSVVTWSRQRRQKQTLKQTLLH